MNYYNGKHILITGGSSGIGLALAQAYGHQGAKVWITGRREEALTTAVAQLETAGIEARYTAADASSMTDNQRTVDELLTAWGSLDVLVCNAGISMRALFAELDIEVFDQVMDINFRGTVYAAKAALPALLESQGDIVGISSINGFRGTPGRTAYSASKHAMQGFFEALRTELIGTGVNCLLVSPGFTGTNIRKASLMADGKPQGESPRDEGKMMTAMEVATRTLRAQKRGKRHLVLTRQGKLVYFLNKWMPGRMDKIVRQHFDKEEGDIS